MYDVAIDTVRRGIAESSDNIMQLVARSGAFLRFIVNLVCHIIGVEFPQTAIQLKEARLVEIEEDLELVVLGVRVDFAVLIELFQRAADKPMAEGEVLVQMLLAAHDQFEKEQVVE